MDVVVIALLALGAIWVLRSRQQRERITLLASYLGRYQIEKLMQTLNEGYMRALGEDDADRRRLVWEHLRASELAISDQLQRFAADFAQADAEATRVSTLPVGLPYAERLVPAAAFDLRRMMALHARGIHDVVHGMADDDARDRAYTLSAEMFLLQHSCHWYCKSRAVASARMWVRHQTRYEQLLDAVSPRTAHDYKELVGA